MTLPQARLLLECSLPDPKRESSYVLILLEYHTRRNYQAYQSHRKRQMLELTKWKSLKKSLSVKMFQYAVLTNEITFMLNYTDYPERMTAEKSADDMLDPGLDNAFSAYPHGRKESAKIGLQGFPGRRFSIEDPDSGYTTIAKSCLVGHRIYLVQAVMPTKLSGQPDLLARPIDVLSRDPDRLGLDTKPAIRQEFHQVAITRPPAAATPADVGNQILELRRLRQTQFLLRYPRFL